MSSATLTSIEATARQLDALRKSRLKEGAVDFDGYMAKRETDAALIKGPKGYHDELVDEFYGDPTLTGRELPWLKTRDHWLIRPGEVTCWTGFNGHGKSMALNYVTLGLMEQGEKTCILSFEMKPRKTLGRMARQAIGVRKPSELYIGKFLDHMQDKLWLYDQQGEVSADRILAVITYCKEKLGITQFVVDSLMKVVSGEDDYNGMKAFVNRLCITARDLGVHVHLVHHSRKKEDETKRPGKQDAKGSGAIVDLVDNFVAVFKLPAKKEADPTAPTHCLYLDKQRHGEFEGHFALWLSDESLQFRESHLERTRSWIK